MCLCLLIDRFGHVCVYVKIVKIVNKLEGKIPNCSFGPNSKDRFGHVCVCVCLWSGGLVELLDVWGACVCVCVCPIPCSEEFHGSVLCFKPCCRSLTR